MSNVTVKISQFPRELLEKAYLEIQENKEKGKKKSNKKGA